MQPILDSLGPARALNAAQILLCLGVAFLLSSLLAAVYRWTHAGFSYSRGFLQTIVLAAIVACIMIIAIGNNLARGLGILGALALIRFRTPIRDPRDIIFLFASLAIGIAAGAQVFLVAVIGGTFFGLAALFLAWSPVSSRREFEGLLRFIAPADRSVDADLQVLFRACCSEVELVSMREAAQGDLLEYAYRVRLVDPTAKAQLLDELRRIPGIEEPSLLMHRSTVEI